MTDKERLEEVKDMLNWADEYQEEGNGRLVEQTAKQMYQEGHIDWLVEQAEELHGTKGRYGYKGMWALCNRDYGRLNAENERYKQAIEKASDELGWGDAENANLRVDRILVRALKGESE